MFEPGDAVIHDPYRGSGHVPEHMLLQPVFWDGELVAFVANVAHMSEVGAKTPGGLSGDATEVFQEGLLIPPVKLKRRGEDVPDIWNLVLTNHRTPRVTNGDFRAMMGSLELAERRVHQLISDHGIELFKTAGSELMTVAERRMRAEDPADPGRCISVRGCDRGRRDRRRRVPDQAAADDRRRGGDRRLHRLCTPGRRAL